MKGRLYILLFLLCLIGFSAYSKNPSKKFFRKANRFYKKYVHEGKVNYPSLIKNRKRLNELVSFIECTNVQSKSVKWQEAYYINVYNLLVIKTIIDFYPVEYPIETIGLFSFVKYKVGNDTLTLNQLESKMLYKQFKDPRILFVLNSATQGAPDLSSRAYKPRKLEKQFRRKLKAVCNSYDYVRVFKKSSLILLGEPLKISDSSFTKQEIVNCINKYREHPLPADYKVDFYPVNRRLNTIIKN